MRSPHYAERETSSAARRRATASPSPRWLHSLNSRPHFSRARLSAAPFTTSTRRASSFYAFIYAPFIIFKVRLFLAPGTERRLFIFCRRPPGDRVLLCPSLYFYFRASYYGVSFFFSLLLRARVFALLYFYVKRRAVAVVYFFFSLIAAHTELWSLKDNLYYGNLGCV